MKLINFQLCLGWIAVIGIPLIIVAIVVWLTLGGEISPSMLVRLVWMPILFAWGWYQIRKYRAIKKSVRGSKDNGSLS